MRVDKVDAVPRSAARRRWRPIDYPRRGRTGLRHWLPSWKLILGTTLFFIGLLVGGFYIALWRVQIPQANDFATRQATVFDYADGTTQIAHVGVNRVSVLLAQVPQTVRHAVLAAEDRSFYREAALSPTGMLRALRNDVTSGGALQGGSTITQQYVKNYYLTEKQTFSRKLDEALVAIKIDQRQSKDTILQNYLNTIFFGRGTYGIQTAARAYFGTDVASLANDPAKAAYLAALVQSPYYYSTANTDPVAAKALRQRWTYVLDGMVSEHWLDAKTRAGLHFPTTIPPNTNDLAGTNGYLVNAAIGYLDQAHRQNPDVPDSTMIMRGGYTVVTTFRQNYMATATTAVQQNLASLTATNPADQNVHIGLAAVDETTGAVVGLYGGADYVKRGYNDATQAAGPIGRSVGDMLAVGVQAKPTADWPTAIAALGQAGITDANPKDVPPSDDDLTATPLRAAAAYQVVANHGGYHPTYEVSEVRYNGAVVWRATPTTETFADSGGRSGTSGSATGGIDGSDQWAWTVGGVGNIAVAVDTYATGPDGRGNRPLAGMTASAPDLTFFKTMAPTSTQRFAMLALVLSGLGARSTHSAAQQRTESIWVSYLGAIVAAGDGVTVNTADVLPPQTTAPYVPDRPAARHATRIPTTTTPPPTTSTTVSPTTTIPPTTSPTPRPVITGKHGRPPTQPPSTSDPGKP
jgi:membrane peptidoglycan carboxypeptidase